MAERVLWLSNETPDRNGQGGQRRQYFQISELVRSGIPVEAITLAGPQDDASLRRIARVRRIRRGRSQPVAAARGRAEVWRALRRSGTVVVVAHAESWPLLDFAIGRRKGPPILVDFHNVWTEAHLARGMQGPADAGRLRERILQAADAISVCSIDESVRLGSTGSTRCLVLPHGFDPDEWPNVPRPTAGPALGAFGSWAWQPNGDGIAWFLAEVWPSLQNALPGVRFSIAGAGLPDSLAATDGVSYLGRVENLEELLRHAAVLVQPVVNGAGAPVKFAEALATGRPLVASPWVAGGLTDVPALLPADTAGWVGGLRHLLLDEVAARALGAAGRAFAVRELTWERTTAPLVDWVRSAPPVGRTG